MHTNEIHIWILHTQLTFSWVHPEKDDQSPLTWCWGLLDLDLHYWNTRLWICPLLFQPNDHASQANLQRPIAVHQSSLWEHTVFHRNLWPSSAAPLGAQGHQSPTSQTAPWDCVGRIERRLWRVRNEKTAVHWFGSINWSKQVISL